MNTLILFFPPTLKMSDEWVNLQKWLHEKEAFGSTESIEECPKLRMSEGLYYQSWMVISVCDSCHLWLRELLLKFSFLHSRENKELWEAWMVDNEAPFRKPIRKQYAMVWVEIASGLIHVETVSQVTAENIWRGWRNDFITSLRQSLYNLGHTSLPKCCKNGLSMRKCGGYSTPLIIPKPMDSWKDKWLVKVVSWTTRISADWSATRCSKWLVGDERS